MPALFRLFHRTGFRAAALGVALVLSGCGGGGVDIGGGGALPLGTLTASASSCSVQEGRSSCDVILLVVTANALQIALKDGDGNSFSVAINQSNTLNVKVPLGGARYSLTFGGSDNVVIVVQASCAAGLVPSNGVCTSPARPG